MDRAHFIARKARASIIRQMLYRLLGGACARCGSTLTLEIDHVLGCTWVQRKLNSTDRWHRYFKEWKMGVQLRLLCRSCNAKHQPKRGRNL